MIPRLGDGNLAASKMIIGIHPRLENDSPSRGRKLNEWKPL